MSKKKLLEKYNDIISSLYKDYVKIKPKKKGKTELWQSKFAGNPYLPKNKKHPLTKSGEYLYLLAQINFEEVPHLHPFPKKGILQFWIYPTIYQGVNLDDRFLQDTFRVIYYPEVQKENLVTDFSYLAPISWDSSSETFGFFPIEYECSLSFSLEKMPVSCSDFRFRTEILSKVAEEEQDDFEEAYYASKALQTYTHRIGGYGSFSQEDPRIWNNYKHKKYDTLLLEIESDFNHGINTTGVLNFFIQEKDLIAQKFSKVMYTMDCG